ncbi:hypothetical protein YPPY66_2612 [Yersinia pestis PY-66]|uniref:Uncharacterized protein n=1 Tax=Yersinia pestis PY-08 TaxID=992134 RepID=A0AB72ZKI9_YERPE
MIKRFLHKKSQLIVFYHIIFIFHLSFDFDDLCHISLMFSM